MELKYAVSYNLIFPKKLKGNKSIKEFATLKDARGYGYTACDWAWNRIEELNIKLLGNLTTDKLFTKKQIGECEEIGMSIYLNHKKKKVYMYDSYINGNLHFKEFSNYMWE